ncbi:CG18233 [Drosophila busckii]|uniref:procollagen-proline 4-dioxygenase n=1 Tax=Drosophila busckii TaxID=30019 RepID=A0A0M4EL54_DROBS|nr:CG18233 [Drosophila busckii]
MLRRLYIDWPAMQKLTLEKEGTAHVKELTKLLKDMPDKYDMQIKLKNLLRIEQTYDLNAVVMAQGKFMNSQFDTAMSVRDYVAVANANYESGHYDKSMLWYRMALEHAEPNAEAHTELLGDAFKDTHAKLAKVYLLYSLSNSYKQLSAAQLNASVDELMSKANEADLKHYTTLLLSEDLNQMLERVNQRKSAPSAHYLGCRGQFATPPKLSCCYNATTSAFLILAPLKMEQISLDPYMVLYHNVISPAESLEMQELSIGAMSNGLSTVNLNNLTSPPDIVARIKWLRTESDFSQRINQRITDMTGFDVKEFPALQVANFGIGNYFMPHFDYMDGDRVHQGEIDELGDRMGSLVFYAGNVTLGGSIVFPELQLAVTAARGSALFWYNLFDDGSKDPRTLHSVCPVVRGTRWTLTKWIHAAPQMFIKPCSKKSV